MSSRGGHRVARATAAAVITVPCVLIAHLLTTGAVASAPVSALIALLVLTVTALLPARSTTGLALVAGAAQLVAHTALALWPAVPGAGTGAVGCLPAVGRGAELGLRLAVLRADGGCPAGTLAAGATLTGALAAVVTAVVIVAAHIAIATLTGLLLSGAQSVCIVVAGLLTTAALVLRRPPSWVPVPRLRTAHPQTRRWVRLRPNPAPRLRRGPPSTVLASS
jgi:hypothetical protein